MFRDSPASCKLKACGIHTEYDKNCNAFCPCYIDFSLSTCAKFEHCIFGKNNEFA